MNKKKRYFKTAAVIFLVVACIATADIVPGRVAAWYDEKTLQTLEYTKITYEPYKISYYDSFAEKMDAICRMDGMIYMLELGERNDILKDEELLLVVNRELKEIYQKGIMPKQVEVSRLLKRSFCELCPIVDHTGGEVIQNAYIWSVYCELEHGTLSIQLDSEYQKIYSILFVTENTWEKSQKTYVVEGRENMDGWLALFMDDYKSEACVKGWMEYWELGNVEYALQVNSYDHQSASGSAHATEKSKDVVQVKAYTLSMPSGVDMNVRMNIYTPYYPSDSWNVFSGTNIVASG